MAEIYPTNTLDEAAAWLAVRTGDDWTAAKLLSAGAAGKLSLLAINPDWIAPGVGELKRQCNGEVVASVSDGFVATNDWTLRTMLSHGRVSSST